MVQCFLDGFIVWLTETTHDLAKWSESHGYFGVLVWIIANSLTDAIENIYGLNPSFLILKAFGINTHLA